MLQRRRSALAWSTLATMVVTAVAMASLWMGSPASADDAPARSGAVELQQAYIDVVAHVRSSVVEVSTPKGLGSGVVYDSKGDIVTNAHVVAGANEFAV